ncbi:hypothetical protein D3C87_2060560 [compost metagenome]
MLIHIRQHRKPVSAVLLGGLLRQRTAQNIAERLRAIVVTSALTQAIQRLEQIIIEGNSDTLHRV